MVDGTVRQYFVGYGAQICFLRAPPVPTVCTRVAYSWKVRLNTYELQPCQHLKRGGPLGAGMPPWSGGSTSQNVLNEALVAPMPPITEGVPQGHALPDTSTSKRATASHSVVAIVEFSVDMLVFWISVLVQTICSVSH